MMFYDDRKLQQQQQQLQQRQLQRDDCNDDDNNSNGIIEPLKETITTAAAASSILASAADSINNNVNDPKSLFLNYLTPQKIDYLLAQELNQMTFQERETILEEIHGVVVNRRRHQNNNDNNKNNNHSNAQDNTASAAATVLVEEDEDETSSEKFVQQKLQELDKELNDILLNNHPQNTNEDDNNHLKKTSTSLPSSLPLHYAYQLAMNNNNNNNNPKCQEYLKSRSFRLMFLRCEDFDVVKAANKLLAYMNGMLEYFGPTVLGRPLYFDDLDMETQKYVQTGVYQLLLTRDSAGRALLFDYHLRMKKLYKDPATLVKTVIYLFHCALQDEMTQKKGLVTIAYFVGKFQGEFSTDTNKRLTKSQAWMPIKLPALHICFDDPTLRAWAPLGKILLGPHLRKRVRIHDGSHTECIYALQSFGIPISSLPVTYQGELKTIFHQRWLAMRYAKEATMKQNSIKNNNIQQEGGEGTTGMTIAANTSTTNHNVKTMMKFDDRGTSATATATATATITNIDNTTTIIDVPSWSDVVLRRGRVFQNHPGNVRMRDLIAQLKKEYDETPVGEKSNVSMKVVHHIKTIEKGRFLRQEEGGWWVEVSDKEAQRRVSKSFRTARAREVASATVTSPTSIGDPSYTPDESTGGGGGGQTSLSSSTGDDGGKKENRPVSSLSYPSTFQQRTTETGGNKRIRLDVKSNNQHHQRDGDNDDVAFQSTPAALDLSAQIPTDRNWCFFPKMPS